MLVNSLSYLEIVRLSKLFPKEKKFSVAAGLTVGFSNETYIYILGGNAKTLMFVNISPADYNCDETITSLT